MSVHAFGGLRNALVAPQCKACLGEPCLELNECRHIVATNVVQARLAIDLSQKESAGTNAIYAFSQHDHRNASIRPSQT